MNITFRMVRIGELFNCNGTLYIKRSSRTALLMAAPRTFYFSQTDLCSV